MKEVCFVNAIKGLVFRLPIVRGIVARYRSLQGRVSRLEAQNRELRTMLYKYMCPERRAKALKDWWRVVKPDEPLNLNNPQTYNEKIQWIKLHGEDPFLTKLADKYAVREWVAERIGEQYLVPLLGVWDRAEDIDFAKLPEKFVIKANHGSGMNIIVTDKEVMDVEAIRHKANGWLLQDFSCQTGFEMQYAGIAPRIIAEEYMENEGGDIFDYKFWCFKGKCHYIQFLSERKKHLKMVFFDREWNVMPFVYDHLRNDNPPQRPANLAEMIAISEKLAEGFEHVRVDLYRLNNGTIRFGEMTFTSASGLCRWDPPEWNLKLGKLFEVRPGNRMTNALAECKTSISAS